MSAPMESASLGSEFLTWLWFRCETGAATFAVDGHEVGLSLVDNLALSGHEDDTQQVLRKGLPTRSAEASTALATGKLLRRATLLLAAGEEEWQATLDGPTLQLASVRCLRVDPDELEAGRDLARMQSFLRLGRLVDGIYAAFLRERLGPEFARGQLLELRAWVAARAAEVGQVE